MSNKLLFTLLIITSISTNIFSQKGSKNITFPIEAMNRKRENSWNEDTLFSSIGKIYFVITPSGKLFWGSNEKKSFQLKMKTIYTIEKAYLHKINNYLLIFYTESDGEGATSRVEKFNLSTKKRIWTAEILGFNLGLPYIIGDLAYVTTIGGVGKLDLNNGNYIYSFFNLYDQKKQSFNSFDTIIFRNNLTSFISKNRTQKRIDSVIVNEKTLRKKVIK
jgi:hypothetical protein